MRRVLALIATCGACVFAGVPGLAAAAPAAAPAVPIIKFELHEDGFLVTVKSEVGEEKVVLTLYRHGEVAYYETPAEFTEDTVKARFGRLGELEYTFSPGERAGPCAEFAEGTYEGTFDFTGENEYVTFEAGRARGTFLGSAAGGCKGSRRPAAADPRSAAADEATLEARTGHKPPIRFLLVFEAEGRHGPAVLFSAFRAERLEGMLVERGAQAVARPGAFRWNLAAGTAHLVPPAPFQGTASFRRNGDGRAVWRGSLRVPVLGARPMRLTGSDFQARLLEGSPLD